ncbi:lincosamide and streptogramin A transport system ATP-binding/permease protein [Lactobacillus colini]|uniref:Lincosamide and streptogramin A transport system ATP-binding/permease protein n=1 Tax=Lactobacillus colini TaxID=1819254 RepID=A0ABS4MG56_9LACO|nr:ATP-binding cassette domain-containing protein [Lactobacillus colini]MBP2058674.1 lincosamide and streptogramin A transport system ATP-binding/permease protein [Lactobacillus colini]
MSNITIKNFSFRYEDRSENIFNNLNLDLDSSWKLGLIGRNGRGKTTFLNLLRNKLSGTGIIQTKLNFSYFPIEIKDPKNITLFELQNQTGFEEWQLRRELNLMGVDPDIIWQTFNTLSGGEQTKVLLALSFTDKYSFSLIDEPTNHLDEKSRLEMVSYLKNHQSGYILVSHDRSFLNKTTDHILAIENTEIHLYQGNYASYEDTKNKRDSFNEAKNQKLHSEISSLTKSARRVRQYSEKSEKQKYYSNHTNEPMGMFDRGYIGHKAAKIMKKSKNMERHINQKISEKKDLLTNIEKAPDLKMNFVPNYHDVLLEIKDLELAFGSKKLFSDLNLTIHNHGIVSLEGRNGSGKSTLLHLLLKEKTEVKETGKLFLTSGLKISYLPQSFSKYHGSLEDFSKKEKIDYTMLLNTLKKLGFPRENFSVAIEDMSMGQQKRVALAKSLVEPANLYLWDEPANYLDVFNQDQLIKLLKRVQPAMLLIEHDQYFIEQVSSSRIKLY